MKNKIFKIAKHKIFSVRLITGLLFLLISSQCLGSESFFFGDDWEYTVRPGDTIWDICQRYVGEPECPKKLIAYNQVKIPKHLPPGIQLLIPIIWLKDKPEPAKTVYVQGTAWIKLPNEEKRLLKIGDLIPMRTVLETEDGNVSTRLADGSYFYLESHSLVSFDQMTSYRRAGMVDTKLRLRRGRARIRVNPFTSPRSTKFEVITPAAVAAVRGTHFRVSYGETPSSIMGIVDEPASSTMKTEVVEGLVGVEAEKQKVFLNKGFGTVTQQGQSPLPPILLPLATQSIRHDIKDGTVQLHWEPVSDSFTYRVTLLKGRELREDNSNPVIDQRITGTNRVEFTYLTPDTYWLRVVAINKFGLHGFESDYNFVIPEKEPQYCFKIDQCKNSFTGISLSVLMILLSL